LLEITLCSKLAQIDDFRVALACHDFSKSARYRHNGEITRFGRTISAGVQAVSGDPNASCSPVLPRCFSCDIALHPDSG
jgi:hypothetical protein